MERGGAREGAGRPKGQPRKTLSQYAVERALEVTRQYAERFGKDTNELLCDIAYGADEMEKATIAQKLKAIEQIHARTAPVRIQEGGDTDKAAAPGIYLPEERPPLNVVPIKEGAS